MVVRDGGALRVVFVVVRSELETLGMEAGATATNQTAAAWLDGRSDNDRVGGGRSNGGGRDAETLLCAERQCREKERQRAVVVFECVAKARRWSRPVLLVAVLIQEHANASQSCPPRANVSLHLA